MQLDDLVLEWLAKAHSDIRSARYLLTMNPVPVEIIGFHAQQGLEKCLKAVLVSRGHEPPRTHDLLFLLRAIGSCCPDLVPPSVDTTCALLNAFAVRHRYPSAESIDVADVVRALERVEAVYEAVTQPPS